MWETAILGAWANASNGSSYTDLICVLLWSIRQLSAEDPTYSSQGRFHPLMKHHTAALFFVTLVLAITSFLWIIRQESVRTAVVAGGAQPIAFTRASDIRTCQVESTAVILLEIGCELAVDLIDRFAPSWLH